MQPLNQRLRQGLRLRSSSAPRPSLLGGGNWPRAGNSKRKKQSTFPHTLCAHSTHVKICPLDVCAIGGWTKAPTRWQVLAIFSSKPTFSSTTTEGASSLAGGLRTAKSVQVAIIPLATAEPLRIGHSLLYKPLAHDHCHCTNNLSQHPPATPTNHNHSPTNMSTFDYTGYKLGEKKVLKENEVTHAPAEVPLLALLPPPQSSSSQHLARLSVALTTTPTLFFVSTEADPGQARRGLEARH